MEKYKGVVKQHILVVDDEAPIRDLLCDFLTKRGYEVSGAETAADALRRADEEPVHLMILDIALPDADGLELLEKVKTSHPNLPVIMLTGMGFDEDLVSEALAKKASGYVSKTLPLDQLLMEIRRALNPG